MAFVPPALDTIEDDKKSPFTPPSLDSIEEEKPASKLLKLDIDPKSLIGVNQPSQFSSGFPLGLASPENPDWDLTRSASRPVVAAVDKTLNNPVTKGLGIAFDTAGKLLSTGAKAILDYAARGGKTDLSKEEFSALVDQINGGTYTGEPPAQSPYDDARLSLPIVPRALAGVGMETIEQSPRLALAAVQPEAGAVSFGFTPKGFDPVQAGTMLIAPEGGKILGNIADKLAVKYGISSQEARDTIAKFGGATGIASIMSAPSIYEISKMPDGEDKNRAIEDTAANAMTVFLLGLTGKSGRTSKEGSTKSSIFSEPKIESEPEKSATEGGTLDRIKNVASMTPEQFIEHVKPENVGELSSLTRKAYELGLASKTDEEIGALKQATDSAKNPFQKQFFREAYEAATKTGSAGFALNNPQAKEIPASSEFKPEESGWRPEIKGWSARVGSYLQGDKTLKDVLELAKQSPENAVWHLKNAARIAADKTNPTYEPKKAQKLLKLADIIDSKLRNVSKPAPEVERYQWMRNAEGGQKFGTRQEIRPLDEEAFQKYIKPRLQQGYANTLAEYQAKNPTDTHYSWIQNEQSQEGRFDNVGSLEQLRPNPENPDWAKKVSDFSSPEAVEQGQIADSELKPQTQTQRVQAALASGQAKTANQLAKELDIINHNVRRILGEGAKAGKFERIAKGVYAMKNENGSFAYIDSTDALTAVPELAKRGVKVDYVFLDPPYKTAAIIGGSRGIKHYFFITPQQFDSLVGSIKTMLRSPDAPVYYMYSQAPSGLKEMQEYTKAFEKNGLSLVANGKWNKTFKSGAPVTTVRGELAAPEGIALFTQSGKVPGETLPTLDFTMVRPPHSGKGGRQSQKPPEMFSKLLGFHTKDVAESEKPNFIAIDPFAGTGGLAEAAKKEGVSSISLDIDEDAVKNFIIPKVEAAAAPAIAEQPEAVKPKSAQTENTQSPEQVLESSDKVKIKLPKGATMLRVSTESGGKKFAPKVISKSELESGNIFKGAGVTKIEAGTMSGKDFIPMNGEVEIVAKQKPSQNVDDWTSATAELANPNQTTELYSGIPLPKFSNIKMTPLDKATAERSAKIQKSFDEARRAQKEINKFPESRQNAMSVYREADGDMATLQSWEAAAKGKLFKQAAKDAQSLTPEEIAMVDKVKSAFDVLGARGQKFDVLGNLRDNYVTHVWDVSGNAKGFGVGVLKQKFKFAKARTFNNFFEGDQAGFTPKTLAIGKLLPAYIHEMNRVIADRQFVQDISEGLASDGRPLVAARGNAIESQEGGKPYLIFPRAFRKRSFDQSDYRTMENQPALRAWRWSAFDDDGNPSVIMQSDLSLHPEAYRRLNSMLGKSAIREWSQEQVGGSGQIPRTIIRALDTAQSAMKREMFGFLAPFHQVQEGTHAIGHLVNPFFGLEKIDMRKPEMMDAANHGLMILPDRTSSNYYMEGVGAKQSLISKGIKKIPAVGKQISDVIDGYQDNLFHQYIPALKFKTYQAMLRRNMALYEPELKSGEMTEADVKITSALQANSAFGHLNYALLDRNPTIQHLLQLSLLAPDFLEARTRFTIQGAKGITSKVGYEQFKAIAILAATQAGIAYTLSQLLGTQYDPKHPFEVVYNGRRYSMRSVPEDIFNFFNDRRQFIYGRINPLTVKAPIEYLTGLNYRGEKQDALQTTEELLTGYIPITLRSIPELRNLTESGRNSPVSPIEQLAGSLGLRISRYSPISETYKNASEWMDSNKIQRDKGSYPVSKYQQLRYALEDGDIKRAGEEYASLLKTMNQAQISKGFRESVNNPFTKNKAMDAQFYQSLPEYQKQLYNLAVKKRQEIISEFDRVLKSNNP